MKKRKRPPGARGLRTRAESRLDRREQARTAKISTAQAQRLLHELEVHQIELELQNEELRATRQEIELALERYSELFHFAPIGYAVLDDGERITAVNHAGAHLLGITRSQLVKHGFGRLIALRDRVSLTGLLRLVRDGAPKATCELELDAGTEPRTIVRLTATMLSRPEPTFLLAFTDITGERRKSAELAVADRALREEHVRKDEFLAMLSHELRNPLTPIRASLFVLGHEPADSARARQAREVIDRQVSQLTRIIDDLLDVTRITRGKVRLKRERFELDALVRSVIDDHRAAFEERELALALRVQPGSFWVDADPTRMIQVLSNLLSNARKFTPRGGRIDVVLRRSGPGVELRICDNGVGIAPEMMGHLFQPFMQSPQSLDRSSGGLGLGLSTVKALVDMQGGKVAIASHGIGRGTEVTLRLPLVNAPELSTSAPAPQPSVRRRVVLIEDNRDTADGLQAVLSSRGHHVRVAYDGPTGIEVVRAFRPDVVVCDLGLPGIDGYSLATILRSDKTLGRVCLVSLSGYARPEDVRRALTAGFDRHIAKPPDLDVLERVIAEAPGAYGERARRPGDLH